MSDTALRELIREVRGKHTPRGIASCNGCHDDWPCDTIRCLDWIVSLEHEIEIWRAAGARFTTQLAALRRLQRERDKRIWWAGWAARANPDKHTDAQSAWDAAKAMLYRDLVAIDAAREEEK